MSLCGSSEAVAGSSVSFGTYANGSGAFGDLGIGGGGGGRLNGGVAGANGAVEVTAQVSA